MTFRLCVLGNSHVAAMKDGWETVGAIKEHVRADFFGCLKAGMESFGAAGDKLGPMEKEAATFFKEIATTGDFIEPGQYDAFVLCGMRFFPNASTIVWQARK